MYYGFVRRLQNAIKSRVYQIQHSTATVNLINPAKQLILQQFGVGLESIIHDLG